MSSNNTVYIIGAGYAGSSIAAQLREKDNPKTIRAFFDDDPEKIGTRIDGIPVLGPIDELISLVNPSAHDEIIIAIPSASVSRSLNIIANLQRQGFLRIKILPHTSQIIDGKAFLHQTRAIEPSDVLSRAPIHIDLSSCFETLAGKRVLITGAGGSIGSELCRQLINAPIEELILAGHGENSLYHIKKELQQLQSDGAGPEVSVQLCLLELQDRHRTGHVMEKYQPHLVIHTAAYKHVPIAEMDPMPVIANNVFGTKNVVDACEAAGTEQLVLVSTDKAVEPSSVYGRTKAISERIVLDHSSKRGMKTFVVRFGNVLGSRGSIVPLFEEQVLAGGPVTLTHQDITRFFMTIPEATSLILKAIEAGESQRLYVLEMGSPIPIRTIAESIIRFYGLEPGQDIQFSVIGLRPGEKLDEALINPWESYGPGPHKAIYDIHNAGAGRDKDQLDQLLNFLEPRCFFSQDRADTYQDDRGAVHAITQYCDHLATRVLHGV